MERILGILGGMGPLATVDFMEKIIKATPARNDQDHLPIITVSLPQIPDRGDAISGIGASPLTAMIKGIRRLERAGAGCIAVPCNTAHRWHGALQNSTGLPILHIADATICLMKSAGIEAGSKVALLATTSTLNVGIYRNRLTAAGLICMEPDAETQKNLVMTGIKAVKAGDLPGGAAALAKAAEHLRRDGADKIILACTEVPLALTHAGVTDPSHIDATYALAKACVNWAQSSDIISVKQVA